MTEESAVAIALWACFDYAAPHPPDRAARIFLAELERLGWTLTTLDDRK